MEDKNNKDFFEEEFEKTQKEQSDESVGSSFGARNTDNPDSKQAWSSYQKAASAAPPTKAKNNTVTIIIAVCVLACAVIFAIGCVSFTTQSSGILEEILQLMDEYYLYDYNEQELLLRAFYGMTESLDPYTHIMTPTQYYELIKAQDNELYYGISYSNDDEGITVQDVRLDSPADSVISIDSEYMGLHEGDVIISCNGLDMTGKSSTDLNELLNSVNGAALTVKRGEKTISFSEMYKRKLAGRYVEYFFLGENNDVYTNMRYYTEVNGVVYSDMPHVENAIQADSSVDFNDVSIYPHYDRYSLENLDSSHVGYIKLFEFSYTEDEIKTYTIKDFAQAMDSFRDAYNGEGMLVLDLNGNGGGYNNYCIDVASYFIYNGKPGERLEVSSLRFKNPVRDEYYYVQSKYADYFNENAPTPQLFVLTNNLSASASEMLTGAILAYGTGVQVGLQTYGKGISQSVVEIGQPVVIQYNGEYVNSSYAFYFTFAKFYTPNIPGSTNKYNNYCTQTDLNGNGILDNGEVPAGFMPEEGNVWALLEEQLKRVNLLATGA